VTILFNKLSKTENTKNIENTENKKENDEELIAVIAAAVFVMTNKPLSAFRVVSFKERKNWNLICNL